MGAKKRPFGGVTSQVLTFERVKGHGEDRKGGLPITRTTWSPRGHGTDEIGSHGPRCRHALKDLFTRALRHSHTRPPKSPLATLGFLTRRRIVAVYPIISTRGQRAMSLSSFSSLSSYTSESDISTLFDFVPFKSSTRGTRRKSPGRPSKSSLSKDRSPSSPRSRHARRKRSVTPTRSPVSSRYDRAVVPYSWRSPGSKSSISYSDIDRWRTATIGGSNFTYSSGSSITQSSVTSSVVSSSRTRSSRIDSSRRSTASSSRQLKAPSVSSRHPHPGIHHEPSGICEHCRTASIILFPPSPR
jgi:hypothetical protein